MIKIVIYEVSVEYVLRPNFTELDEELDKIAGKPICSCGAGLGMRDRQYQYQDYNKAVEVARQMKKLEWVESVDVDGEKI